VAAFEGLGDMEGSQTASRNVLAALLRFLSKACLAARWPLPLMTRSIAAGIAALAGIAAVCACGWG
jgi:hypothetical protein